MTDLRTAAQQLLGACEQRLPLKGQAEIIDELNNLRAALAEPVQDGCNHCNHPMYAAIKCRVCGRVTEPVEPVAYSVGRSLHWHQGRGVTDAQLYIAPPQRKPLSEAKIKKLLIESAGMTIQFNDVDLRFARAIERAHEIGEQQ